MTLFETSSMSSIWCQTWTLVECKGCHKPNQQVQYTTLFEANLKEFLGVLAELCILID